MRGRRVHGLWGAIQTGGPVQRICAVWLPAHAPEAVSTTHCTCTYGTLACCRLTQRTPGMAHATVAPFAHEMQNEPIVPPLEVGALFTPRTDGTVGEHQHQQGMAPMP